MAATKITEEVLRKRSEGIKRAKSSPEHRQKMSKITTELWEDPTYRAKQSNRTAWNKLPDSKKIEKTCPECKVKFLVVPAHKNRKCCSRKCADALRTGRPHKNWNPNSLQNAGYDQCLKGTYKEQYSFRSSYELSAIVQLLNEGNSIEIEPFYVWYEYNGNQRRYFPDILVNNNIVVEIKPTNRVGEDVNVAKFEAAKKWCKENNYVFEIWDEDKIDLLSKDEITNMSLNGDVILTKGITPCNQKKKQ